MDAPDRPLEAAPSGPASPVDGPRVGFLRRALRLAGPYWNAPHRRRIRAAAVVLLLLTVAQVALAVWTNHWNRALFDALEQRAVQAIMLQVGVFALIFALTIAVTAAHLRVKRWLQVDWRAWLTRELVGRWMDDGRHHGLLYRPGEHDNPDARIAEDIRIATENAVALAHSLVYALLTFGVFVDILWRLSGSLAIPGTSLLVPGYLVPLAFAYAALGAVLGWGFGRPLVRSTNALQSSEADFRFGLARAREHAEAIALMRGEPMEREGAARRFARVVRDWDRQSLAYMGIVGFSTGYGALLPVFPILVAAPQYILGAMSLGALMQAAQAFQKLTSALSWPTDNLGEIARTRASADRVLSLYEDMQRLDREAARPDAPRIVVRRGTLPRLVVEDLCIADPDGRVLVEHVGFGVAPRERLLVAGDPAVTGTLFKVIAGLWPWGTGRVWLPERGTIAFLAQRPFLPEGTLRDALCYPRPADAHPHEAICRALECAGVAWLAPRLDEPDHWEQSLPMRTQQRLGIARLLLLQPAWILMEEATDAFDPRGERLMLEMLRRELPDSGWLTIGFHPGLEPLHEHKVVLNRLNPSRWLAHAGPAGDAAAH
jgi:putative ATP-binding cassette transporter